MTIATRFTADQLVIDTEYVHSLKGKIVAQGTIDLCKLIQNAYPEVLFAVDGKTNEVDFRGRVHVYVGDEFAGRTDVDHINGALRYTFEGPFVDKGEANYRGDGKVWRKDAAKLVAAIQEKNCIRTQTPQELYDKAYAALERKAAAELIEEDWLAGDIIRLSREQAVSLALGAQPFNKLAELLEKLRDIRIKVAAVQATARHANAELAASFGVAPSLLSILTHRPNLRTVLAALNTQQVQA